MIGRSPRPPEAAVAPRPGHRRALLSLHDVTPFHLDRLTRMEEVLEGLGAESVAYLLIPNFHGKAPADTEAFRGWCRRERSYDVEWILHGLYHRETELDAPNPPRLGPIDHFMRRYATAGEGEFAALAPAEARRRIRIGMDAFERVIGERPRGFVPPAWLHKPVLGEILRDEGFDFWENRRHVYDLTGGHTIAAPVITWATRTPALKWGSLAGTPLLRALWHREPVVRLAMHPSDVDDRTTLGSIRHVCRRTLASRHQCSYRELLSSTA